MNTISENITLTWLQKASEIEPGESAILNENYIAFYGIHCTAIVLIITSLISCLLVISSILCNSKKERWDFSDRFPLYLAIADGLWGISHLTDHMVLVTTLQYPGPTLATGLSINLWLFLGYQQLMHGGLAAYTYLKIVRRISLNLGKGEWRLHLFCVTLMGVSIAIFYPLGSFGCSGYWFLQNVKSNAGIALGIYIASSATMQALFTTLGYKEIQKVINYQRIALTAHNEQNTLKPQTHHSTATRCLNTFVRIALCLYCPLAIAYWSFVIESLFGFIEPLTVLVIVIVANSSGWANALGYFYNKRVKAKRKKEKEFKNLPTLSSNSTDNFRHSNS